MIFTQLSEQLDYLRQLLADLSQSNFTHPSKYLSNATIGGHTRHILELLGCAVNGYDIGVVDYYNRVRDLSIEQDKDQALSLLTILEYSAQRPDKLIKLSGDGLMVDTSYYREIVYNIEHAIHHLALIKVALVEMGIDNIDQNFGMAYSTIKYKQERSTIQA